MFEAFFASHDLRSLLVPQDQRKLFPHASDRAAWERVPLLESILAWGDEAKQGYPPLPASKYLAFARNGDREVFETPYFKRRTLLIGATLAECAAHDGRYLDAVIDGLWAVCEETSWVVSAHNGAADGKPGHQRTTPLPDADNPYIDLFAAQTAATLAHTAALLADELDAVTPLLHKRVHREVEKRVLTPFMQRDDFWWMGFIRKNLINWTPWILSNVIDSFLLLETDDDRLAAALTRAAGMLDRYLDCQPADGGCDEGCGYWNMAGASLLDCLESLQLATGGAMDFYGEPLIRSLAAFPQSAHIVGDWYWNFADCDAKPILDGERVYTFGRRVHNPTLEALGYQIAAGQSSAVPRETPQMSRLLNALFTPMQKPDVPETGERTVSLPRLQVFAFERGAFYAVIKGGHNGESHNHNDVGSLILFYGNKPCVVDAGNMTYTAKTFSEERYTLWNTRAAFHNVPLIGGMEQREGTQYRAENVRASKDGVGMELQRAYPPEAKVKSYSRILTAGKNVSVQDDVCLTEAKTVSWVWLFRPKPEPGETTNGRSELYAGSVRMTWPETLSFRREEIPVTDQRMVRSFPGSLWRVTLTSPPGMHCEALFEFSGR